MTGQNAARHHTTNWINPDKNNAGPSGPPDWNWRGSEQATSRCRGCCKPAGYRTIHVGKGHFGARAFEGAEPKNLGFDVNVAGCSIGAPGSYYGKKNYGNGTKRASHAVPAPGKVPRHRDVSHRSADDRSQAARRRCGEGRQAVLPLHGPLRRARAVQFRSAVCRPLQGLRQARARPGVRHADRRHGQVARRHARPSRRAGRRRQHADLLPRRQRLRRAARARARRGLRRSAARQEGRPLRGRHARALHRRLGQGQRRQSASAAAADRGRRRSRASRPPFTTCSPPFSALADVQRPKDHVVDGSPARHAADRQARQARARRRS